MKILALESSAVACSAALCEDEHLLAEAYQNSGLTHSRTLMPMVAGLLENCGASLSDVDAIAVAVGPGSFTGLRIGVAAAKGLAWAENKPCAPCSTLESMAWLMAHLEDEEVCAVMDARRNEVYNARFLIKDCVPVRLTPDRAISLEALGDEIKNNKKTQFLVGDGAKLCYTVLGERCNLRLPPDHLRYQRACGVARAAFRMAQDGKLISAHALAPNYLRLSQAERERLAKQKEKGE